MRPALDIPDRFTSRVPEREPEEGRVPDAVEAGLDRWLAEPTFEERLSAADRERLAERELAGATVGPAGFDPDADR